MEPNRKPFADQLYSYLAILTWLQYHRNSIRSHLNNFNLAERNLDNFKRSNAACYSNGCHWYLALDLIMNGSLILR